MSQSFDSIEVNVGGDKLLFTNVSFVFLKHGLCDVFRHKNNKTLRETLGHRRYKSVSQAVASNYQTDLDKPLGLFLSALKAQGNETYLRFLNPHGDKRYCQFRMADVPVKRLKGLYLYTCDGEIMYIGRSFDSFGKRINQGYGKIHPKNCFIDGQSTNCHLNALIADSTKAVALFLHPMTDNTEIESTERFLITELKPPWNIALAQ